MKDREFENYLALLSGMLRLRRTQREGIAGELRDHLIEHVAHLEASGSSHEEAVRRALEEFGDAAALAANFQALVGMRRRRLVMRCTIGTTVVMTGLVVAMLAFRPPVMDDPSIVKAQAGSAGSAATAAADSKTSATRRNDELSAATRRKLDTLIDVEFNEVPLREALNNIGAKLGVQFYLDENSLSDLSVTADTQVTLQLQQVPAEMAIDLIMRRLQSGYTVRSGVVMVFSKTALDEHVETRVYYVANQGARELAELIPGSIAPATWDLVGGSASIRVFRESLVISQTPEVHQKIEKLLKDLEPALAQAPKEPMPDGETSRYLGTPGYGRAPGYGGTSPPSGGYSGAR